MIEPIGPHFFKDPALRQLREDHECAHRALLSLWNAETTELQPGDFLTYYNALQQAQQFPPHVKRLVEELETAISWGHEKKIRELARQLLPFFS